MHIKKRIKNITGVYDKPKANLRKKKKKQKHSITPEFYHLNYDSEEFWILKTNAYFLHNL